MNSPHRKKSLVLKDDKGKPYLSVDKSDIVKELRTRARFHDIENLHGGSHKVPEGASEGASKLYKKGFVRAKVDASTILGMSREILDDHEIAVPGTDWYGGSLQAWEDRMHTPDPEAIDAATTLFAELDRSVDLEHLKARTVLSYVGGSPSVAAYVGGSPRAMRRRVKSPCEGGITRLLVGLNACSSISSSDMRTRGIAIMGLARSMQQVRPVEVWACFGSKLSTPKANGQVDGYQRRRYQCSMVRVSMAPMDLSRGSRLLSDPYFKRGVLHSLNRRLAGSWGGENLDGFPFPDVGLDVLCGATEDDVVIPGMYSDRRAVDEPEAWVKDELEKWLSGAEDSLARKGW